jgi:hypothetical protein
LQVAVREALVRGDGYLSMRRDLGAYKCNFRRDSRPGSGCILVALLNTKQ